MKIVEDHTVDEQSNLDKSLLSSKRQFSGKKSNNQHDVKTLASLRSDIAAEALKKEEYSSSRG